MRAILFLFVILFSNLNLKSQTFKVHSATSQDWAGGVCCASGTNYQIVLVTDRTEEKIRIDSLWIGQKLFALNDKDGYSVVCNKNSEKTFYTINVGVSTNRYGDYEIDPIDDKKTIEKAPKYSGAGLLIYHINKKRMVIEILSFKELPYLAYP